MTTDITLEAEARALFEADPSSKFEASWDNLASYKRWAWIDIASIARQRENATKDPLDTASHTD